jgi:hypothetical protein
MTIRFLYYKTPAKERLKMMTERAENILSTYLNGARFKDE